MEVILRQEEIPEAVREDDMREKPERGQEPGKKENPQESMPPDMPSGGSTENSSSEGGGSL